MITTTLNRIRAHQPCEKGWTKLLNRLGKTKADDEPLPFSVILKSNGLDDALWCCRCEPQSDKEWRLFAVWCARQVQHLMTDKRSINAIDIAERYASGQATKGELDAAWTATEGAAWVAARAAAEAAAWVAAEAAAEAAARAAARATARTAAWVAARTAAWVAARDAAWVAARAAAEAAARDSAWTAARDAQTRQFLNIVGEQE
jgi:hypothetical protein